MTTAKLRNSTGNSVKISGGKSVTRYIMVAWPPRLKVAVPESVVVRIASNDAEDLLAGIDPSRKIKTENFEGEARLEVTLTPDPGLDVVKQHSDIQVVVRGQKHREWSWSVWPKVPGPHQLSLLVQGISGSYREDYDPEVMQYEVAFNLWYWLWNGIQQNGISWAWAVILVVITNAITLWLSKRNSSNGDPPPSSPDPKAATLDQ
jgi:hypothetical protein